MPNKLRNAKSLALLVLVFAFSILIFNFSIAYAQTPLESAHSAYTQEFTKYTQTKDSYITAKATYSKFKTATAKTDAFQKTKDYLVQIDTMYLSYFSYITQYGNSVDWSKTTLDQQVQNQKIIEEIAWISNHRDETAQKSTLEELPPQATQLANHLETLAKPRSRLAVITFKLAKSENSFNNFLALYGQTEAFVTPKLQESNPTVLNNWKPEMEKIKSDIETQISISKTELTKVKESRFSDREVTNVNSNVETIKSKLKKSITLLEEILRIL